VVLTPTALADPAHDAAEYDTESVRDALHNACTLVAPLWPLERFVAVNPYLGLTGLPFPEAAGRLAAAGGVHTAMPVDWYLERVEQGLVTHADVAAALAAASDTPVTEPAEFLAQARSLDHAVPRTPTVMQVATATTGDDWTRFVVDRISLWAASHFDQGQAIWRPGPAGGCYAAWHFEASIDRTPEIMGLPGVRASVRALPTDPVLAAAHALRVLGIAPEDAEPYLHALLLQLGGWAAHAARLAWEAAQQGGHDDTPLELLAVLLSWEALLLDSPALPGLPGAWAAAGTACAGAATGAASGSVTQLPALVLQDAWDRAAARELVDACAANALTAPVATTAPDIQAVFCIDVRSEVMRRHLERGAGTTNIETLGFAGFFGFPVEVVALAHEHGAAQCPVLLTPGASVDETAGTRNATADAVAHRRLAHHVKRAWKSFKMGAISCFSFVGPVGLGYLPKLVTDGAGLTRPVPHPDVEGLAHATAAQLRPSIASMALADQVRMAEGALRGMSLTRDFAPLVVLVGHGASTVNNPYATGLDCGACGGHSGAVNARVAALVLNDPAVRAELATRDIVVPDSTWFAAALHDTTTDQVTVFADEPLPETHQALAAAFVEQGALAGRAARAERAPRLGIDVATLDTDAVDRQVIRRSTDWAQTRPEWGLAGCRAFIAAPRTLTAGLDLDGRVFLHSYDHTLDADGGVLELIMTAPMVVASWINLQYYASTVDGEHYGAGDKTIHNVVGRLGVLEGNGGDLRTGLPQQSVHDGTAPVHQPLRLAVVLAAPRAAIDRVLDTHAEVRALVDHEWVHLLAMDDAGRITHRRTPGEGWTEA